MSSKFKRSALGARVPHEKKTSGMATGAMPLPEKIVLPMQQHIGAPCTPTVKTVSYTHLDVYKRQFPVWLAPVQVKVIPISEAHHAYAKQEIGRAHV